MNSGVYTVIPTFFDDNMNVDIDMLKQHMHYQYKMGYSKFVFLGTTSETPTLNIDEMKSIIKTVTSMKRDEDTYVFGISGNDPTKIINNMIELNYMEVADVIMLSSPYYNKPSQAGLISFFSKILSEFSEKKFMLYNIPGRTGVNIKPSTFNVLSMLHKNFIAIKEASGDIKQIMDTIIMLPNIMVFSGDDKLALPGYSIGTKGTISVASNVTPMVNMLYHSFNTHNSIKMSKHINDIMNNLNDTLFMDSNPVPLKVILSMIYDNQQFKNVRNPLVSTEHKETIVNNYLKFKEDESTMDSLYRESFI